MGHEAPVTAVQRPGAHSCPETGQLWGRWGPEPADQRPAIPMAPEDRHVRGVCGLSGPHRQVRAQRHCSAGSTGIGVGREGHGARLGRKTMGASGWSPVGIWEGTEARAEAPEWGGDLEEATGRGKGADVHEPKGWRDRGGALGSRQEVWVRNGGRGSGPGGPAPATGPRAQELRVLGWDGGQRMACGTTEPTHPAGRAGWARVPHGPSWEPTGQGQGPYLNAPPHPSGGPAMSGG